MKNKFLFYLRIKNVFGTLEIPRNGWLLSFNSDLFFLQKLLLKVQYYVMGLSLVLSCFDLSKQLRIDKRRVYPETSVDTKEVYGLSISKGSFWGSVFLLGGHFFIKMTLETFGDHFFDSTPSKGF